jgi:hypothetical protein
MMERDQATLMMEEARQHCSVTGCAAVLRPGSNHDLEPKLRHVAAEQKKQTPKIKISHA